jgi:hypothetical protein
MRCKTCGNDLDVSEFYSSNKSRCKECIKSSVRENRVANIEHYRSFDRMRASQPHRVQARIAYQKTEAYSISHRRACSKYRVDQPKRRAAQIAVGNAVRDGRLQRQPCFICGCKAEAHHPDYDHPLDVTWLCSKHHKQAHALATNDERKEAA